MLGVLGIDSFDMNGVITPGTYLDYFNKEFLKHNSKIITRRIYNEQRSKKLSAFTGDEYTQ